MNTTTVHLPLQLPWCQAQSQLATLDFPNVLSVQHKHSGLGTSRQQSQSWCSHCNPVSGSTKYLFHSLLPCHLQHFCNSFLCLSEHQLYISWHRCCWWDVVTCVLSFHLLVHAVWVCHFPFPFSFTRTTTYIFGGPFHWVLGFHTDHWSHLLQWHIVHVIAGITCCGEHGGHVNCVQAEVHILAAMSMKLQSCSHAVWLPVMKGMITAQKKRHVFRTICKML